MVVGTSANLYPKDLCCVMRVLMHVYRKPQLGSHVHCHDVKVPPCRNGSARPQTAENGCRIGSAVVPKFLSSPDIRCCGRS